MTSSHPWTPGRLWWLARRDLARGPRAAWHDHVISKKILRSPIQLPTISKASTLPSVHVLTGEEQWIMTCWMLASWLHSTQRSWRVVLHDDGSLTNSSQGALSQRFPGIEIIKRKESDETMASALATAPACTAYRDQHPLGIKCFDIPHYASKDRIILLDSDVLFFKEPTEILAWADAPTNRTCWFNQDPQEPSPISTQTCQDQFGFGLWPRVNSGLCLLDKKAISFSDFETWIQHPDIANGIPWRREQTLLAMAASQYGQGGLLKEVYEVSLGKSRQPESTARHYVGAVRNQFYSEGIHHVKHSLL